MILYYILILLIFILLFLCFFYRIKEGKYYENNIISSPSYGKIIHIDKNFKLNNQKYILVSIFLSINDIHYQYFPISGVINSIKYDNTGKFKLAFNYNKSKDNEKVITTMKTDYGNIIVQQIAGFFVRRISTMISNIDSEGVKVNVGDKLFDVPELSAR